MIGFHQAQINPMLAAHWPSLELTKDASVLVPLCGKTLDMLWLAARGHSVFGVELSETACEAFFTENDLPFDRAQMDDGVLFTGCHETLDVRLWCGDFFDVPAERFGRFDACFDRASLIALPQPLQERHASSLRTLLSPGASGLLLGIDYDQSQRQGPPFSTPQKRVYDLLAEAFDLSVLQEEDLSGSEFAERMDLDRINEYCMSLERLGS
jgi:thiopurine S-methyltransferase